MVYPSPLIFLILERLINLEHSYTHQLAKILSVSPPHINRICNDLEKENVLDSSFQDNRKLFKLNYECLLTKAFLRLLTIMKVKQSKYFQKLAEMCPFGIYGSFAEGKQRKESDLDIWVYSSRSKEKIIRPILNSIEEEWGHPINIIYLDKNKLEDMKASDSEFYLRLRTQSLTEREDIFE